MRAKDIKVGQEVAVLGRGDRRDLANASVIRCTVLHGDLWSAERWQDHPVAVTGPDGRQFEVSSAHPDPRGKLVLVSGNFGPYELVGLSRILGPADEWEPRVATAKEANLQQRREAAERLIARRQEAEQLEDAFRGVGVKASVFLRGRTNQVEVTIYDDASERALKALLLRAAESEGEA